MFASCRKRRPRDNPGESDENSPDKRRIKGENKGMPPALVDYIELRARSAFSFLEGASNPEDLVERAGALDYPALALADRGGVYGAPRFHQAARRAGVRAILGAEIDLETGEGESDAPAPQLTLTVYTPSAATYWSMSCPPMTSV